MSPRKTRKELSLKPPVCPKFKHCSKCETRKPASEFSPDTTNASGLNSRCKECRRQHANGKNAARAKAADAQAQRIVDEQRARAARLESDFATLKPEDFDVTVANDISPAARRRSARASREKRQEYNENMGRYLTSLRAHATGTGRMDDGLAEYVSNLAEQERRFQNRRDARSISIFEANEVLNHRRFVMLAERFLAGRISPVGYARKKKLSPTRRSVCLLLSDLHLGAELHELDNPVPFRATEEARRLEHVLRQVLEYKPQYRDHSECVLLLNGDLIQGQLGHDLRGGAPLAEQKLIFWRYFEAFIGEVAAAYPRVRVVCQPGNHGRDKMRHPGRATQRKWDSHEWEMYKALELMSRRLENVTWQIDFRAVSIVDLYGSKAGMTHADTEVKVGHPDTAAAKNRAVLDKINTSRLYGVEFAAWLFGHYHTGRYQPGKPAVIFNAALIPPDGHARTEGYIGEAAGQFMWEAVEGHPVGDLRFIRVGPEQDADERLGSLIKPFRITD
jgi:hypothetical protein